MVYVPLGTWAEAVYNGDWYQFNNIREAAMQTAIISPTEAYMLMDAQTCSYTINDGMSEDVQMVPAFYNIDEKDPNNSWQIVCLNDKQYLYNIGAKKYAYITTDGNIKLSDTLFPLKFTDTESGIIFDGNTHHKWCFVVNKNVSVNNISSIATTDRSQNNICNYFSIDGQRMSFLRKGVNIVHHNGTARKIVVR